MSWTTPKTWNVGDPGTASDLNQYVRDNSAYLYGDTSWTAISPFTNSWGNLGGYTAQYRRIGATVALEGAIVGGATGTVAFTLPVGYRPAVKCNFAPASSSSAVGTVIQFATAGTATISNLSTGAWMALDGIVLPLF